MRDVKNEPLSKKSIASLIAWLSVCLLAAACGSTFDPSWRPVWFELGTFGLVSAVGLSIAARFRGQRLHRAREAEAQSTMERRMKAIVDQHELPALLRDTIKQLHQEIGCHEPKRDGAAVPRTEATGRSIVVAPLREGDDGALVRDGSEFAATIRDISARGIGLEHDIPLSSSWALLTYPAADGNSLDIVVGLRWTKRLDAGLYASGCEFADVGTPDLKDAALAQASAVD